MALGRPEFPKRHLLYRQRPTIRLASQMTKTLRVFNVTSGDRPRFNQAARKVAEGICAWVEYGVSIRTLTLQEQIAARNEAARMREPLEYAELPGLRFDHPAARVEAMVAAMATRFAAECTQ